MTNLEYAPPKHVDEPGVVDGYADVVEDAVLRRQAEQLSASINWRRVVKNSVPHQEWFDGDEPKPF